MANILLVDDDRPQLRAIERVLGAAEHQTTATEYSDAAIRELDSSSFDIVLADYHMSSPNGIEG